MPWNLLAPPIPSFNICVCHPSSHRVSSISLLLVTYQKVGDLGGLGGGGRRDGSAVACGETQDCLYQQLHGDPEATGPGAKLRNANNRELALDHLNKLKFLPARGKGERRCGLLSQLSASCHLVSGPESVSWEKSPFLAPESEALHGTLELRNSVLIRDLESE